MIESLIGLAIGFGILLVGVLRGGAGGGDAKLAGALGAWLGLGILQAISIACVIGLGWGIIRLHRNGLLKTRIKLFFRGIYYWLVYGMQGVLPVSKLPDDEKAPLPFEAIPFGVCLAAGAWIVWAIIIFQGVGMKIVW
jgi:prepilin signal peptidase PulO-like enzyme (type II secretory pathway)